MFSIRPLFTVVEELKYILLIKRDIKLPKQSQLFILEGSFRMMPFLILDVPYHRAELRTSIRKRTESFLPTKPADEPATLINES